MGAQFRTQLQQQHQDPGDPAESSQSPQEPAQADDSQPAARGTKSGKAGQQRPARAPRGKSLEERQAAAAALLGREPEDKAGEPDPEKPAEEPKSEQKPAESKADARPLDAEGKTALAQLLTSGNLTELAKQLGVDAKSVDASSAKLALVRKRQQSAEASERAVKEIREECKRLYKDPHAARKAVDEGRFSDAAQYMEHVLGMTFAEFTRKVATATKGMSPEELERHKKERELKAREEALAEKERKSATEKSEQERVEKACKSITAKLANHDVLKIKNGARLVYKLLDENFDPETGTLKLGYKQAADQVLADFESNAKALGWSKGGKQEQAPEKKPDPESKPGKQEFPAPAGEHNGESGKTRRGKSFEERAALASRKFERSRL